MHQQRRLSSVLCFPLFILIMTCKTAARSTAFLLSRTTSTSTRRLSHRGHSCVLKVAKRWTSSDIDINTCPLSSFCSFPAYQLPSPPPDLTQLQPGQRVVTFGDVHGDLDALQEFLTIAGVYDLHSGKWIGGTTICVQCGDILDRGNEELACLELVCNLSKQAQEAGGSLQMLFGNHEALNAVGLFQYTTGDDEFEFQIGKPLDLLSPVSHKWRLQFAGNQPARWAACEPGGLLSGWLQNCQVVCVVGRTVCVHAGLTKEHLLKYGGIEGMNAQAREWIAKQQHLQNNNLFPNATVNTVIEEAQARAQVASKSMPACLGGGIGSDSPVWMRDYSAPNDAPPKNRQAQKMIGTCIVNVMLCVCIVCECSVLLTICSI